MGFVASFSRNLRFKIHDGRGAGATWTVPARGASARGHSAQSVAARGAPPGGGANAIRNRACVNSRTRLRLAALRTLAAVPVVKIEDEPRQLRRWRENAIRANHHFD